MADEPEHINPYAAPLADSHTVPQVSDLSDAEQTRQNHLGREATIKSIGLLYYLGAVILTGVFVMFVVDVVDQGGAANGEQSIAIAGSLFTFVFAALGWWIGRGLRTLNTVARVLAIIMGIIGITTSLIGFNPIGLLIQGAILASLVGEKATLIFSPEYKEVIAATPHIKYKTSIIVWVLLGILLSLIGLGIIAAIASGVAG